MKKSVIAGIIITAAMSITACGSSQYVTTLGAYKGVEVTVEPKEEITQEAVDAYIDNVLNSKTTYQAVEREVQEEDQVNIDYVGKINGEAFEGGSSAEGGYDLVIGSNSFIEGFEEGLIGSKAGETKDLNLNFPEDYSVSELAGKPVVFTVSVNEVREPVKPELTDEFVASLNQTGCSTAEEYREYVKNTLEEQAQYTFDQNVQDAAFEVVFRESVTDEIPEDLINEYYNRAVSQVDQYASYYGQDRDSFIKQNLHMTTEEFEEEAKKTAEDSAKRELIMKSIASKEKIKIKKADIDTFINENMSYYGYQSADAMKESMGEEQIEKYLMFDRVYTLIGDNAKVTEQEGISAETQASEQPETEEVETQETGTQEAAEEESSADTQ